MQLDELIDQTPEGGLDGIEPPTNTHVVTFSSGIDDFLQVEHGWPRFEGAQHPLELVSRVGQIIEIPALNRLPEPINDSARIIDDQRRHPLQQFRIVGKPPERGGKTLSLMFVHRILKETNSGRRSGADHPVAAAAA